MKIDLYNFELYRFKFSAFLRHCAERNLYVKKAYVL